MFCRFVWIVAGLFLIYYVYYDFVIKNYSVINDYKKHKFIFVLYHPLSWFHGCYTSVKSDFFREKASSLEIYDFS